MYLDAKRAARRQQQGRSRIVSIPAPTGGLNTRDSLDQMEPTDAVVMDNMIPSIGKVSLRKGYEDFVTGIAADIGGTWAADEIETLFTLVVGSNEQFLCAMDGGIARIDSGTAVEIEPDGTYTSDRWQYTTFQDATSGQPKILAVNGTDTPWTYDGTTHAAWAFEEDNGSGGTQAVTEENFVWVTTFKNRVFLGEANSRDFYYGQLGAIPGAGSTTTMITKFPLSGIRGAQGNILFMGALTRDTGSGPDDFAVFVTDQGQVIVYQGSNPGDAAAWSIVGVYKIPKPINSRRAHAQLFGDIVIATELDYIFLNAALRESGAVILTPTKMTGALSSAAASHKDNYGWEMVISETDNLLISNIPRQTNAQYHQHVFNLQTRAASRFTGLNFRTFAVWNGKLYGATNNAVYRVLSRLSDDASTGEDPIQMRVQTAWTDLQSAEIKHVKAMRALLRSQGAFSYGAKVGVDFIDPQVSVKASAGPTSETTLWGDAPGVTTLWGDTAATQTYWAGTTTASPASAREWRLLSGRGSDFCLSLSADVKDQLVDWLSTDYKLHLSGRF